MTSREFATRLERRLTRADVLLPDAEVVAMLEAYYSILSKWNARINLTSLPLEDGPPATLDRLLVEPLAAARHVREGTFNWVDLGSGGGSPAIPLKIVRRAAILTMVEATTKKATFLKEVVRELRLEAASVENLRIEELENRPAVIGRTELVTARAVRMTSALFDAIRMLLAPGGSLHLYANRPPEIPPVSGFSIDAVHKLGTGLETKLIVLKSLAQGSEASTTPMDTKAPPAMAPSPRAVSARVPRGTRRARLAPPVRRSASKRR
jgi:16S rRNA (guanine527-N7)-methyltransferase